jgi:putative transposase
MLKAYKYRIYPNKEQSYLLSQHFGCVRLVYNLALSKKKEAYELDKTSVSTFDLIKELPKLKDSEKYSFLKEVNSQSLQQVIKSNLDSAFKNFFRRVKDVSCKEKGFPKFKSKHENQSFMCPQGTKVNFEHSKLCIPKIRNIKCKFHREFTGSVRSCTISKTPTGKYYVSILVEDHKELPSKLEINSKYSLGVDLGIAHFLTTSRGEKIENPKFLRNNLERLKVLQQRLSKKVKRSNNRNKARHIVALQHEKITNCRKDFLHKLSSKLVSENQTICLEDLNISGMLKNHCLAQAISDVSWSEFITMLKYKAEFYGRNVLQIGRFEPSSKLCSCGMKNEELTLKDRSWTCKSCGTQHDRDILVANNIKKFALRDYSTTRLEQPEEPVETSTLVESMKQEATTSKVVGSSQVKEKETQMNNEQVSILLNQMGGKKAMFMLGTSLNNCLLDEGKLIIKKIKSRKANTLEISLVNDLYDLKFSIGSITKNFEYKEKNVKTFEGLFADQLKGTIEENTGLYLSL